MKKNANSNIKFEFQARVEKININGLERTHNDILYAQFKKLFLIKNFMEVC